MVKSARDIFRVASPEEYRTKLEQAMAARRKMGIPASVVIEVDTPALAEVNNGRWTVECPCGASDATDPAWGVAGCFGCGTWLTHVVFPENANAIELVLGERPHDGNQNWKVGEPVELLEAENEIMIKGRR